MGEVIRKAIRETGYTSLGTLEFLMDEDDEALLPRDEHARAGRAPRHRDGRPGSISSTLQIRAAAGEKLDLPDTRPWSFRGHAIECRINAEDPKTFAPWPGLITEYHPPGGAGVRVDSRRLRRLARPGRLRLAPRQGHRPRARRAPRRIVRMRRALDEFIVGGIRTNIELHKRLLADDEVIRGEMTTRTIERLLADTRGMS